MSDRLQAAAALRTDILGLTDEVQAKTHALDLPAPSPAYDQMRTRLADNRYRVLVAGEAKRGKSSLINALIGRPLLPTDVAIATSQVFMVTHAEQDEAFRIRFEDGSATPISIDDLPRYGSQEFQNREETPPAAEIVRWIEVDCPVRFLPPNVALLDTPGLGSLYAAHAQITYRFVPEADGVIFVLDSERPIQQAEIDFLERLVTVTTDILFVQTKIDAVRETAWRTILSRNEQILNKTFGERLGDIDIWPLSAHNLMDAAHAEDSGDAELLREESRYGELLQALQNFLFRVAGWRRSVACMALALDHHETGRTLLRNRLADLAEENKQQQAERQQRAAADRQSFEAEWGERGSARQKLALEIHRICTLAAAELQRKLQIGSELFQPVQERIEQASSIDVLRTLNQTVGNDLVDAAFGEWIRLQRLATEHCLEQLGPFAEAARQVLLPAEAPGQQRLGPEMAGASLRERNYLFENLRGFMQGGGITSGAAYIAGTILVAASIISVPAVLIAVGIAALVGGFTGVKESRLRQVEELRNQVRRHAAEIVDKLRHHLFDPNLAAGRSGLVEQCFEDLERLLMEHVQSVAQRQIAAARTEAQKAAQAAALETDQRKRQAAALRDRMAEWDNLGARLRRAVQTLEQLDPGRKPASGSKRGSDRNGPQKTR